jgi:phage gp16-like protein
MEGEKMVSDKYWMMLDYSHPKHVTDVVGLINWSFNCDAPTPYMLFQDLIGYSDEVYGEKLCKKMPMLGHIEIGYLAEALMEYANRPHDVTEWMDKLRKEEEK